MNNETLEKIVEGAAKDIVKEPYIKAEITGINESGITITTEYNCNNVREAAAMVASLATELCENRADYNKLTTLIRKQLKFERSRRK